MYILECADNSLYVASTIDIERRLAQHQAGEGANDTRSRLPVQLVFAKEFAHIDEAFAREKQLQNWSSSKRFALIQRRFRVLNRLSRKRKPLRRSPLVE